MIYDRIPHFAVLLLLILDTFHSLSLFSPLATPFILYYLYVDRYRHKRFYDLDHSIAKGRGKSNSILKNRVFVT